MKFILKTHQCPLNKQHLQSTKQFPGTSHLIPWVSMLTFGYCEALTLLIWFLQYIMEFFKLHILLALLQASQNKFWEGEGIENSITTILEAYSLVFTVMIFTVFQITPLTGHCGTYLKSQHQEGCNLRGQPGPICNYSKILPHTK